MAIQKLPSDPPGLHAELENSTLNAHLSGLLGSGISVWGNSHRIELKLLQAGAGHHLHVYYIGGSITGCHLVQKCWVDRVDQWFKATFPGRTSCHNEARGATDSIFAASCIDHLVGEVSSPCPSVHLLSHKTN